MSQAAPDVATSSVTLASGLRMPYVEAGAGDPLVFVHGSLCDYRYWQPQLAALSARYRCIAPSLTHYWPAADTPADAPFSWSRHADEVGEFLAALDLPPAHVVGHSRGGCVVWYSALRHSERFRSLTLADPGGGTRTQPSAPDASETVNALRARAASLIEAGDTEAGLQLFVDSVSQPGFWARSTRAFRTMAADNASTLPRQFRDPLPSYTEDDARRMRPPVLLIDGEKSPAMFRRTVDALALWLPDSHRATIAGASHGMNLQHPGAFNRALDARLADPSGTNVA